MLDLHVQHIQLNPVELQMCHQCFHHHYHYHLIWFYKIIVFIFINSFIIELHILTGKWQAFIFLCSIWFKEIIFYKWFQEVLVTSSKKWLHVWNYNNYCYSSIHVIIYYCHIRQYFTWLNTCWASSSVLNDTKPYLQHSSVNMRLINCDC